MCANLLQNRFANAKLFLKLKWDQFWSILYLIKKELLTSDYSVKSYAWPYIKKNTRVDLTTSSVLSSQKETSIILKGLSCHHIRVVILQNVSVVCRRTRCCGRASRRWRACCARSPTWTSTTWRGSTRSWPRTPPSPPRSTRASATCSRRSPPG